MPAAGNGKRLLLTVLGTNPQPANYQLGDRCHEAEIATVALYELLPPEQRPDCIIALCTPEAEEKSFRILEGELKSKVHLRVQPIQKEQTENLSEYLKVLSNAITGAGASSLLLDVTHGFRHLTFLTYVGTLYISTLLQIPLEGAYYGLLERGRPVAPFLDLQPSISLPEWVYAVKRFRESGDARGLVDLLDKGRFKASQVARKHLKDFSFAFFAGLPLELGKAAHQTRPQLGSLRKDLIQAGVPLASELVAQIEKPLNEFELPNVGGGPGWKAKVELNHDELDRQRRLIERLWEQGHHIAAIGLMREWLVSWTVLLGGGNDWLNMDGARGQAERRLGALLAIRNARQEQLKELAAHFSEEQKALASLWEKVTNARNAYHHHGMRRQDLLEEAGDLEKLWEQWNEFLNKEQLWRQREGELVEQILKLPGRLEGVVLVSPLGKTKGVLYSALETVRAEEGRLPDACLVVTSEEVKDGAEEAFDRAGFSGQKHIILFGDPYAGLQEMDDRVGEALAMLAGASETYINVTGGTTLIGLTVEQIASRARDLAVPVKRFGLVDKRPYPEQLSDPWQKGEAIWLDASKG